MGEDEYHYQLGLLKEYLSGGSMHIDDLNEAIEYIVDFLDQKPF